MLSLEHFWNFYRNRVKVFMITCTKMKRQAYNAIMFNLILSELYKDDLFRYLL